MNESLMRDTSKFHFSPSFFFLQFRAPPFSLSFPPLKHPLQASYPRHILGGEAPSSMAYSLVDGASPLLFSFAFRYISMVENHHWRTSMKLKDPVSIEAPQASFHHLTCSKFPVFIHSWPRHRCHKELSLDAWLPACEIVKTKFFIKDPWRMYRFPCLVPCITINFPFPLIFITLSST